METSKINSILKLMDPTLYPDEGPQFDHKCFFSGAIGSQVHFRGLKEQKASYLDTL